MAEVLLTVLVRRPPVGHLVGLQCGKASAATTESPIRTTGDDLSLQLTLEHRDGKFRGPHVQQDSKGQFVYLRWGVSAGDRSATCDRRTKVYLGLLTPEVIAAGKPLALAYEGTAKDGFPACATVKVELA